ncbi:MAG: protein kinase, partial [Elusimicrobia bacterium]|nr:protein kinase [Elusimicrobiota bacterium]
MDDASLSGETLRQDEKQAESSRRLSGREGARQDPDAPRIDGYTLTARLGAGAYGEVWKAWQKRTGKWVAVKVFPRRHGVDWLLLQREVERLIKLDKHPHVVSLLDADLTGDLPYFAMEYMEGGALTRFVDSKNRATPEQAAEWAEQIAHALCYVHTKGVLHCDLKPANILLDDQGRVRVADFGQSRIVSESTGALGTLYFMAPEQALTFKQNEQLCPDARWDLFGLGATLYAVLTGRAPHEDQLKSELEKAGSLDARLEAYRNGIRKAAVPTLDVDEDLAAIVRGLLEPWPENRYANSGALLADLAARRESKPISRLSSGFLYKARKFVRRNTAATGLAVLLAAAIGLGTSTVFRQNAQLEAELGNAYALRARAASDKGDDAAAAVLFARANALHPSGLSRRSALAHLSVLERPLNVWSLAGPIDAVAFSPDGSKIVAGGESADPFVIDAKTGRVFGPTKKPGLVSLVVAGFLGGPPDGSLPASFSKDGTKALVYSGGKIDVLDAQTGSVLASSIGSASARFTEAGKILLSGRQDSRGDVVEIDAATGKPTGIRFHHPIEKESWTFPTFGVSPDGKKVVTALNGRFLLHDAATGKALGAPVRYNAETGLMIAPLEVMSFMPLGNQLLSTTWNRVALIDPATGKTIGKPMRHDGHITAWGASPSGAEIYTAGEDGLLRKWSAYQVGDSEPGHPVDAPMRHGAPITALAIDPNASYLATAGKDGVARLWSVRSGGSWSPWGRAMVHGGQILSLAFSQDGKFLATGGRDGTVRLWAVPSDPGGRTEEKNYAHNSTLSLETMRYAGEQDGLSIYEAPSMKPVAESLLQGRMGVLDPVFSGDGKRLVSSARGTVEA